MIIEIISIVVVVCMGIVANQLTRQIDARAHDDDDDMSKRHFL